MYGDLHSMTTRGSLFTKSIMSGKIFWLIPDTLN